MGKPICLNGFAFSSRASFYVEPFAGGAKLLFAKEPSPTEILNDVDNNIVNLYRVIQNSEKRQKLVNLFNETPYSRSVFQSWKYGDKTTQDDIEKAGRYFFLCKASFAGDVERGGFGMPSKELAGIQQEHSGRQLIALILLQRGLRMRLSNAWIMLIASRGMTLRALYFMPIPPLPEHRTLLRQGCFTLEDHHKLAELLHDIKRSCNGHALSE